MKWWVIYLVSYFTIYWNAWLTDESYNMTWDDVGWRIMVYMWNNCNQPPHSYACAAANNASVHSVKFSETIAINRISVVHALQLTNLELTILCTVISFCSGCHYCCLRMSSSIGRSRAICQSGSRSVSKSVSQLQSVSQSTKQSVRKPVCTPVSQLLCRQ